MRQSDKVNLPFFSMATLWFLSLDWSGTLRVIMLLLIRRAVAACSAPEPSHYSGMQWKMTTKLIP